MNETDFNLHRLQKIEEYSHLVEVSEASFHQALETLKENKRELNHWRTLTFEQFSESANQ